MLNVNGVIYLIANYHHPDKVVAKNRRENVFGFIAKKTMEGYKIFAPGLWINEVAKFIPAGRKFTKDADFWKEYMKEFILASDQVVVVKSKDWKENKEIVWQIEYAKEYDRPVEYITIDYEQ